MRKLVQTCSKKKSSVLDTSACSEKQHCNFLTLETSSYDSFIMSTNAMKNYSSSHNHASLKRVPPILVTIQMQPFNFFFRLCLKEVTYSKAQWHQPIPSDWNICQTYTNPFPTDWFWTVILSHFGAKKLRIISQGAAACGKDDMCGTVGIKPSNRSDLSGEGRHVWRLRIWMELYPIPFIWRWYIYLHYYMNGWFYGKCR